MSRGRECRDVDLVNLGLAMFAGPPSKDVQGEVVKLRVTIDEPIVWEAAAVAAAAAGIELQDHLFEHMHSDWISAGPARERRGKPGGDDAQVVARSPTDDGQPRQGVPRTAQSGPGPAAQLVRVWTARMCDSGR